MKAFVLLFLMVVTGVASDPGWKKLEGRFATFEAPAGMTKNTKGFALDSIQESFESPDILFSFDSEGVVLPARLQRELEQTVSTWAAGRREHWAKSQDVVDGGRTIGYIYGEESEKNVPFYKMRNYLYLGFSTDAGNFSLHIRFRSLDRLDDVEKMLKSLRLKTE